MIEIKKASTSHFKLLSGLGKRTFLESHGTSASPSDLEEYTSKTYSEDNTRKELENSDFIYHLIYHNGVPVGFSKIILNSPHPKITEPNITKLERLYILKEYYDLKLGKKLFNFNVEISKNSNQLGMWLNVWVENYRAIKFYEKNGFKKIADFSFKISEKHFNPNYQMYLEY